MDNSAIVRAIFEQYFNEGDESIPDRYVADKYDFHNGSVELPRTRESFKRGMRRVRTAFPDMHFEIGLLVESGDMVAVRSNLTGTHTGEFLGLPPSGRRIVAGVADFYRFEDGLIVEHWDVVDMLAVLLRTDAPLPPEITTNAERWGFLAVQ